MIKVSTEAVESFQEFKAEYQIRKSDLSVREQVRAQISRASAVARRNGHYQLNNGETIFYKTPWANIGYDSETDTLTQAALLGVYAVRYKFFTGELKNVQLYLRVASSDTPTYPEMYNDYSYDYWALFSGRSQEITVPKQDPDEKEFFPSNGDVILPETRKWHEIDYVLGQVALNHA